MTKMLSSSDFEGLAQALQAPDAGKEQTPRQSCSLPSNSCTVAAEAIFDRFWCCGG